MVELSVSNQMIFNLYMNFLAHYLESKSMFYKIIFSWNISLNAETHVNS